MEKYIVFDSNYKGKDGKMFFKNIKYKVKSSDSKYYYFSTEKISKEIENKSYKIGDVIE